MATGGGRTAKRLYTDGDEFVQSACRPVILNGIELGDRPDLSSRTIRLDLPVIPEDSGYTVERRLFAEFDREHPQLLGALLEHALAGIVAGVDFGARDRLAGQDGRSRPLGNGCRAEPRLGAALLRGALREGAGRADGVRRRGRGLAGVRADLVRENGGAYDGTATELLRALLKRADASPKDFGWPRSPKGMADALTRYAPLLRATGITHRTVPDRHAKTDRHHFSTDGDAGDAGVAAPSVPGMEEEREGGEVAIPLGKTATPATPATPAKTNPMDDLGLKADLPPTSPHLDHTPCPPDLYRAHIQDVYRDPNGPGWICPAGCAYPTGDASAALVN